MDKKFYLILLSIILMVSCMLEQSLQAQQRGGGSETRYHGPFIENFTKSTSEFFNYNIRRSGYDFRYYSGIPSLSEKGTDIMMYRIDPEDPAGAGRGPEIISKIILIMVLTLHESKFRMSQKFNPMLSGGRLFHI